MDSDGAQCHLRPTKLRPCTDREVKPQLTLSANGTTTDAAGWTAMVPSVICVQRN